MHILDFQFYTQKLERKRKKNGNVVRTLIWIRPVWRRVDPCGMKCGQVGILQTFRGWLMDWNCQVKNLEDFYFALTSFISRLLTVPDDKESVKFRWSRYVLPTNEVAGR